ncbi:uncharacterized protein LOC113378319 [Ctenocephalides felis]|uniref:uncharacterized protein LOC113378319 n=1 Tax=Ctenocephalides felis TaxID=7515 RepID=UPI000E6E17D9|nr:uncharacterized protein LOC113378319 [Ctenocephalides felis]
MTHTRHSLSENAMRFLNRPITYLLLIVINSLLLLSTNEVSCQEPAFELPVQLIGFPVIILAVRLSNFVKKLAYSLSPQTYAPNSSSQIPSNYNSAISSNTIQRSKRSTLENLRQDFEVNFDIDEAERKLVASLGDDVCVMQRVCVQHAVKSVERSKRNANLETIAKRFGMLGEQPDWEEILSGYLSSSNQDKQWYLLSVFVGDVMKDPDFCRKLAKRRPCQHDGGHNI